MVSIPHLLFPQPLVELDAEILHDGLDVVHLGHGAEPAHHRHEGVGAAVNGSGAAVFTAAAASAAALIPAMLLHPLAVVLPGV